MLTLIEKLKSVAADAKRHASEATRTATETAEAAKQAATKAESLSREVETAQQILKTADEQLDFYTKRAAELREAALGIWGQSRLYMGMTITSSPVYSTLAGVLVAIEDYGRVRPILVSRVEAAQTELDAFAQASTDL